VNFFTQIALANADANTMKFITNPTVLGIMKTRPKQAGFPIFLAGDDGKVNAFPVEWSNQISSGFAFFGDWSQAIAGMWGAVDILVNPYILSGTGSIRVEVYVTADFAARHANAFAVAANVS
jgi:hypothetical protein